MAMMSAEEYFASFSPEEQAKIQDSWGGQDLLQEWWQAAADAGAVPDTSPQGGGGGGWTPKNKQELVQYAAEQGWSEDFARFDPATVQSWINNYWDPSAGAFRTAKTDPQGNPIEGFVEKPDDVPEGWEAWGQFARRVDGGGGGGGPASFGGGGGGGSLADLLGSLGAPPEFEAPTWESAMEDPGYQAALKSGEQALGRSQAAKGVLRTGGSLKDLLDYNQGMAAQQYDKTWQRALGEYGTRYRPWETMFGASEDRWRTQYGGDLAKWQTQYGGDLQKYLQKEGNLFDLLSSPPPYYGG